MIRQAVTNKAVFHTFLCFILLGPAVAQAALTVGCYPRLASSVTVGSNGVSETITDSLDNNLTQFQDALESCNQNFSFNTVYEVDGVKATAVSSLTRRVSLTDSGLGYIIDATGSTTTTASVGSSADLLSSLEAIASAGNGEFLTISEPDIFLFSKR